MWLNKLRIKMFSVLVLLMWVLPSHAEASGQVELKAGMPSFPPFAYPRLNDSSRGIAVRYLNMLSDKTGIQIRPVFLPYARTIQSLRRGELDFAVIFHNPQVSEAVDYVAKVSESRVLVLPKTGIHLKQYEQLLSLQNIAVIRNASFEHRFDNDTRLKKYFVNDYRQALQMLHRGRVDAVVGSMSGLDYNSRTLGVGFETWGEPLALDNKEWWLHMSKASRHRELVPQLKAAVEALYQPYLFYSLYQQNTPEETH